MTYQTAGIHHITSFVRHPQDNVDFYAGILGLRLVKKTINFDAPDVYHLYFGNEIGGPGTIITFFPSAGSRLGKVGGGQVGYTTFAVPTGALSFWEARLAQFGVAFERTERFGETYLQFKDRDGLQLEIVEREEGAPSPWSFGGVSTDKAIKGFGGAILYSINSAKTPDTLATVMGLQKVGEENGLRPLPRCRRHRQRDRHQRQIDAFGAKAAPERCITSHGGPPHTRTMPIGADTSSSTASIRPISSTANTSTRSTSAKPAASCSRSRPTRQASSETNRPMPWASKLMLP